MNTLWRLIAPIEANGVTQMAIDEWLLEQHRLGCGPPCLRFYTWNPISISLGYHQHQYPNHWNSLQWHGDVIHIVRRPSGGRAVLHQGDLTYSLVMSGCSGRRRDIYAELCQFLIDGWKQLGIALHLGGDKRSYQRSHNCFGTATAADLVMENGYKLIGSAQLYRDNCVLQHGSIRLFPNPDLVRAVFGYDISSPDILSHIQPENVLDALTAAAECSFNIKFQEQPLSLQEQTQAVNWAHSRTKTLD
ncbi:MAG: lipoate--protein ligase family protein [Leptolyngbyaceae cyanobacterium MAG.088]|nr:lipoate--protein ligase family protein [Leptolyngbyaceae cyanobacterium MAG.088]